MQIAFLWLDVDEEKRPYRLVFHFALGSKDLRQFHLLAPSNDWCINFEISDMHILGGSHFEFDKFYFCDEAP